jgi:hypothetical protein
MLRHFRPIHPSSLQRAIYVVCMLLVFSYILFDVLDLDGSNSPSFATPLERSVIVAEVLPEIQIAYSSDRVERLQNIAVLFADRSREYARFQITKVHRSSLLDSARAHGYRIGLGRDALPD